MSFINRLKRVGERTQPWRRSCGSEWFSCASIYSDCACDRVCQIQSTNTQVGARGGLETRLERLAENIKIHVCFCLCIPIVAHSKKSRTGGKESLEIRLIHYNDKIKGATYI